MSETDGHLNNAIERNDRLLQAELNKYKRDFKALQEEFNTVDEENSPEVIKRGLLAACPAAIQEIIALATTAESESVRGSMSKYIVDVGLGKVGVGDTGKESLSKLLNELRKNDPKRATSGPHVSGIPSSKK